ncbi:helix-turn-helix protein [Flavobacterium sp. 90]|uniref:helix-turn-helix domain-containing protein n=1 Tax=unclassified Flavobacterium TaxID=196869 RepID=UPI000EABE682|nr:MULTISPECIES: AraC family transcriptional regulator [unclassified Flavobacterium]RKR05170.1 helix-turn-helix protein [Flavobacterium sp. 81]TCK56486.1 helix-turn-helix protein [Flavobacterium sp. 90]
MIKDLINIELKDLPVEGLDIHIIKKYVIKTSADESFVVSNFSILLIKSGKFKIQLKEIAQELTARDLMIIPKNSYCTILEVHDKMQLFLISFTSDFVFKNSLKKELVESFYFLIAKSSMKIQLEEKDFLVLTLIYKLIYLVIKDVEKNVFDQDLQRISFNLFLYELKQIYIRYNTNLILNLTRKESLTIEFLTIVTIHCIKHHSVKFYAGSLFVTSGYLSKIVKQTTGKTVKRIIADAIIIEAKNLLEDLHLTITMIAEELEFSDAYTFSKFFKKHTSFSPSEYRSNTIVRFKSH